MPSPPALSDFDGRWHLINALSADISPHYTAAIHVYSFLSSYSGECVSRACRIHQPLALPDSVSNGRGLSL